MDCKYFDSGICKLASNKAGMQVRTYEQTCHACLSGKNVIQGLITLEKFNQGKLKDVTNIGPGTELKKLISWFPIPNKNGCRSCNNLEVRMNKWGPDICERKLDFICKKLWVAAARRGIPYNKTLTEVLVRKAIRNARKAS
jgi:hypothetical protein